MHPVRNTIQHIDFQRVSATEKIHVKVPFHFLNEDVAPGVKLGGGIVAHILTEADVSCLPKDLPEFIEVDVAKLEIGQSVHLSEITLPKGVEFVQLAHDNDAAVAAIAKTRGSLADDTADANVAATESATPAS
jgi:large subunit ribosomal protein L25